MVNGSPEMARRKQGIEEIIWPAGFVDFQHARLEPAPPVGPAWIHEVKFDGYRLQAHTRRGRATLYTRNGHDWTDKMPSLAAQVAALPDCVLDGELCVLNAEGYSDFSALRAGINPKSEDRLALMVFDILFHQGDDLRPYALKARKAVLEQVLPEPVGPLRPVAAVAGEGPRLLDAACRLGWEGIVSKRLDAPYRAGRGDAWVKSKCRPSETVVVGGWVTKGILFSYLIAGVREPDGRLRYAGSIKGGYGRDAEAVARRVKALETDVCPFDIGAPRKTSDIHWARPELLAEVEMAEFTPSGKLRQATFKGLRDDLV